MLIDIVLAALLATPQSLGVHPAATATVRISGASAPLQVTPSSPALASVSVDQGSATITIQAGPTAGSETLHVTDATGASIDIPVLIAPDAAVVPGSVDLNVTGNPLDPQWLAAQIAGAVARAVVLQPGASLHVASVTPPPLDPGSTASLAVPVTVDGHGTSLDVSAQTNVNVTNVAEEPLAPPLLFYDDDPEHLTADGISYRGTVEAGTPARLYLYHDDLGDPHRVVVVLSASSPATVQVIDADAGPNIDVLSVGHAVARSFLAQKGRNEGTIYTIDPGAPLVLHDITETNKQLVAAAIELNVLEGGPVVATVLSASPGTDPLSLLNGPLLATDGHHRTGVFAITNFGTDSLSYTVGGPDASSTFGSKTETPPNVDPKSDGSDYGDYGVVHTFLFNVSNPSAEPARVYLYERPAGGYVRASFLVNGDLIDVGCVRESSVRYQIAAFDLSPNQKYLFDVQTMTEGGSNYPLEVGMTTTAPQPAAPPMSAPDGCFPKR